MALAEKLASTITGCRVTIAVITPSGSMWLPELSLEVPASCQEHCVECSLFKALQKEESHNERTEL